jgi:hypothetical protein
MMYHQHDGNTADDKQSQHKQTSAMIEGENSVPGDDTYKANSEEQMAILLTVIGFFFGGILLWFIVYSLYKSSISKGARRWAKISGILALVIGGLIVFTFMTSVLVVCIYLYLTVKR